MAAEPAAVADEVSSQAADSVDTVSSLVGEFHYTGRLSTNQNLGTVHVTSNAKTVNWTVGRTGSSGLVNLRLTNSSTGESRSLSATADNQLGSLTWVSALPAGYYDVTVIYTSGLWNYDVDLYFYN